MEGVTSRLLVMIATSEIHTLNYEISIAKPSPTINPPIQFLIQKYKHLFQTPTALPPPRNQDHAIPLKPNTEPVNTRPYRYSHYQKDEIERLMEEMLNDGVIRPSTSPCLTYIAS